LTLIDRLLGRKNFDIVDLAKSFGFSTPVKSGVRVGLTQALQVSTLFACLRVLGEGVAQVPFKVKKKTGKQIDDADKHALFDVLSTQPNDWQSSFELRETMVWHAALCGSAYCYINRGPRDEVLELIPLQPTTVTTLQAADHSLSYRVTSVAGGQRIFPQSAIWHLRGPSWNGFEGLSVMRLAREALGLSIASEEHHSRVHKNGVNPSGLYSVDGTLSAAQYKEMREWLLKEHVGSENTGVPMIADRGAKFTPFSLKGVDMQHLETRKHQIEEVCRYVRVLPVMIGFADKTATYASSEQMFLAHLVHTLMPWYSRIEGSANVQLLTAAERAAGFYTKFTERGLLRGAMKDEAEYFSKLVSTGVLTRNEARELMDRNPIEGLDKPLTPMNLNGKPNADDPPEGSNNAA
jgi:HK97 family phage portal protein